MMGALRYLLLLGLCFTGLASAYGRIAVIPQQAEDTVLLFDTDTNKNLALLQVARAPVGVGISEDGKFAYITHPERGLVTEIDLAAKKISKTIFVGGQPFGIQLHQTWRRMLFITDWSRDALVVVDAERGLVVDLLAVGQAPAGIAIDPVKKRIYTANREDNTVSVLDLFKPRQYGLIETGKGPYALALSPDGATLFVASVQDSILAAYDTDTLLEKGRAETGGYPYAIAIAEDMSAVYVSNQGDDTISRFSYGDLTEQGRIAVGKSPEAIDFIDRDTLLVTNWFSDDLSIVDLAAEKETRRIPVGKGARAFGRFISP